jgi:hypothetical protein
VLAREKHQACCTRWISAAFSWRLKGELQTVDLRLANLLAAQTGCRCGDGVFVNDIDALNRRVVGIDAGQHAVFKECFQRMLGQRCTVLV